MFILSILDPNQAYNKTYTTININKSHIHVAIYTIHILIYYDLLIYPSYMDKYLIYVYRL